MNTLASGSSLQVRDAVRDLRDAARTAAQDARTAARDAAQGARDAAQGARDAAQAARDAAQAGQSSPPDAPLPPDPPSPTGFQVNGEDGIPITFDFQNGNVIIKQGTRTTSIPWQEAVPKGAVQIVWAVPATLSILLIWWPISRAVVSWLRRKAVVNNENAALEARMRERFEVLERNVDTVAIEMERVAEGQRFTNKLLTERQDGVGVPANAAGVPVGSSRL